VGGTVSDPLNAAERYRKDAAEFSELAKTAETPFIRGYYRRLAQRYLMHAENQEKLARISEGFADDRRQTDQIADSPNVQPASEAVLPACRSAPAQGPTGAPLRSRRRRRPPCQ
jgi:hypothetical protein